MQERIHGQIVDTYCRMAEEVHYRPAAPARDDEAVSVICSSKCFSCGGA
jgi:hypothetical protein